MLSVMGNIFIILKRKNTRKNTEIILLNALSYGEHFYYSEEEKYRYNPA